MKYNRRDRNLADHHYDHDSANTDSTLCLSSGRTITLICPCQPCNGTNSRSAAMGDSGEPSRQRCYFFVPPSPDPAFSSSFFCETGHVLCSALEYAHERCAHLLLLPERRSVPKMTSCERWRHPEEGIWTLTSLSAAAGLRHSPSCPLPSAAASSAPSSGPSPAGCHLHVHERYETGPAVNRGSSIGISTADIRVISPLPLSVDECREVVVQVKVCVGR